MADPSLLTIYEKLYTAYSPQHWWPAHSRTEMMIGAILTQNTAWTQVENALSTLRKNAALDFQTLEKTQGDRITEWIRPAGSFNQKTDCLKTLAAMICREFGGSLDPLFRLDTPELREQLLAVKGIGPETADCILLYAAQRPVFVVDAYTRRLLIAHGYILEAEQSYDKVATLFTSGLPRKVQLYNEYHALIVRWGKDHPKQPKAAS